MATQATNHAPPWGDEKPVKAVLVGGSIVGILDLAYAILVYSPKAPLLIPQTIASDILGVRSCERGPKTAALGALLHFFIAFSAAGIYYLARRRLRFLMNRAVVSGLIYGALVYLVMHWIVLPLSAVPRGDMPAIYKACEFVEHCFLWDCPSR